MVLAMTLAGCGGISPRPAVLAAREPTAVTLDEDQQRRLAAHVQQALTHVGAEEWQLARRAARAALALDPRCARAHAVLGRCRMAAAMAIDPPDLPTWRQAEGDLALAARLAPTDAEIALLHADLLTADGHWSAARTALTGALAAQPDHLELLRRAGRLSYELGDERGAVPLLERLVDRQPAAEERFMLARCRLQIAETAVREGVAAGERDPLVRAAIAEFARYRDAVPQDAEGHAGEAFARLLALRAGGGGGPAAEAAEAAALDAIDALLATASRLDPGAPQHWFNRGVVAEMRGDPDTARSRFSRALESNPRYLPALLNLAASLAADGRGDEAVAYVRRALDLQPTDDERRRLLEFLDRQEGDSTDSAGLRP